MASTKRISLSKLSEYLTASPSRRKSIIQDAADPKPAKTYNAASEAISKDILSGATDGAGIASKIGDLKKQLDAGLPDWQRQHVLNCIEALERYLTAKSSLGLASWKIKPPTVGPGNMIISGVRVAVSPEALLLKAGGKYDSCRRDQILFLEIESTRQKASGVSGGHHGLVLREASRFARLGGLSMLTRCRSARQCGSHRT